MLNVKDATLSPEDIMTILDKADIVSDDTGRFLKNGGRKKSKFSSEDERSEARNEDGNSVSFVHDELFQKLESKQLTPQQQSNIELLMDVNVNITVELGRTVLRMQDVLGLGEGSIIELKKSSDDPVDLLVNDCLIAQGEVVVIDENFGTRVVKIIDLEERKKRLLKL